MKRQSIAEALRDGIAEEMARDNRVFCIGEDIGVPGGWGGAFTATLGLQEKFPGRILNTPVFMSVAEGDDITLWEKEIEVFNRIATPKKQLLVCEGTSHMTLYSNVSRLEFLAQKGKEFLVEQLIMRFS